MNNIKIYAVDFDGCLAISDEDLKIVKKNDDVFNYFLNLDRNKNKIILWTCRTGKQLEEAIIFCKENGLVFDKINDNLEEIKFKGCYSRKVFADYYVDDKNIDMYKLSEVDNGAN